MRRALVVVSLLALSLVPAALAPSRAGARLSSEYGYTYDQIWRATVRMIAVDYRFPITDRDPEIGYVLFEYRDNGRAYAGSMEIVRSDDARAPIRVVAQVGSMPSYVERMLLDRLGRKLGEEYGAPPVRRPAPSAPPTPAPVDPAPPAEPPSDDADPAP